MKSGDIYKSRLQKKVKEPVAGVVQVVRRVQTTLTSYTFFAPDTTSLFFNYVDDSEVHIQPQC